MSHELFPGREVALARWAFYASGRWGLPVKYAGSQAKLPQNVVAAPESSGDILHDIAPGRVVSWV
jgi:hypothetical protein